jgi:hypothetical protein
MIVCNKCENSVIWYKISFFCINDYHQQAERTSSADDDYDYSSGEEAKDENAIDYSDITEAVDDTEGGSSNGMQSQAVDNDKLIMPPPAWIPDHAASQETLVCVINQF